MNKITVRLQPLVTGIDLPTVLKTALLPGGSAERLLIATQPGVIYIVGDGMIGTFLDIRQRVISLGGSGGGYDERGFLGLAFHPDFSANGLFYLHYSLAGTQGPGAPEGSFLPDPCRPETLNLKWVNREERYDHIDTVEEWSMQTGGQPQKRRTLLNLRRPFMNHNGVNSLNFSPETGKLVLTTGDGGSGYDPFNLSQNTMEIAGKIIEIDVSSNAFSDDPAAVTRFDELSAAAQEALTVIAKGVRNIPGIAFQWFYNCYIKYVGNVGQDLVESVFSFDRYQPLPVARLVQGYFNNTDPDQEGLINLGWRGWEGSFTTSIIRNCPGDPVFNEKTIAFYREAVETSELRLQPLTCYYHEDPRPERFQGTALTGVQPYVGSALPNLTDTIVFSDFARTHELPRQSPARGVLAYTGVKTDCILNEFSVIETDYDFGDQSAFYTCLGTNQDQTRLYLGVYGSMNVTDFGQGTVFEIVP